MVKLGAALPADVVVPWRCACLEDSRWSPGHYERQRDTRRQIAHHSGKLGDLGFEVTLRRIPEPEPEPGGPADTRAA